MMTFGSSATGPAPIAFMEKLSQKHRRILVILVKTATRMVSEKSLAQMEPLLKAISSKSPIQPFHYLRVRVYLERRRLWLFPPLFFFVQQPPFRFLVLRLPPVVVRVNPASPRELYK